MRSSFALLFITLPLAAQFKRFEPGVTGGVSFTTPTTSSAFVRGESRRYTVGGTLETFLNANVSLDAGVLFKRIGNFQNYSFLANRGLPVESIRTETVRMRGLSWEAPVLGKYTFGNAGAKLRPFAGAGFAFRLSFNSNDNTFARGDGTGRQSFNSSARTPLDVGAVFGGGVRLTTGRLTLVPELRYTRWGATTFDQSRNRHQAEALFTIRF